LEGREKQKATPVRRWLLIFSSFPKVEVGGLDQVELIMKNQHPKDMNLPFRG
jgi:hypothetical protein